MSNEVSKDFFEYGASFIVTKSDYLDYYCGKEGVLGAGGERFVTPTNGKADIKTERLCTMFNKLKRWYDGKGKRAVALLATVILLCGFTGCERSTIPDGSEISYSETGFDIERIRKNVVVDGQAIEIPIKLKELPKDWTYETSANRFAEDRCHVEVKDKNGDLLFSCGAENYKESKKGDSRIFDAPFENDKCSVDGITPFKTTREEIVERYGEATSIKNFNSKKYEGWQEYRYGSLEGKTSNDWHGKCLIVTFNEKGIVDWVTIVYTD